MTQAERFANRFPRLRFIIRGDTIFKIENDGINVQARGFLQPSDLIARRQQHRPT